MCFDLDWRDRLHLYGIVATWLLVLFAGLLLDAIATDVANAISPDNAGWRTAFRLMLLVCVFFTILLINAARFRTPLNAWSKLSTLLGHLSDSAGLDAGPSSVGGQSSVVFPQTTKARTAAVYQPLLRPTTQSRTAMAPARPRGPVQPMTTITVVKSDAMTRGMTVETAPVAPTYDALRSNETQQPQQMQQQQQAVDTAFPFSLQ